MKHVADEIATTEPLPDPETADGQLAVAVWTKFQGPLPHPKVLAAYEETLPGAAERIFSAWEKESEDRRGLTSRLVDHEFRFRNQAQIFGFVIAVLFLGVSAWLIDRGHDATGIALIFSEIVALVGAFILGRSRSGKHRRSEDGENGENRTKNSG